MRDEAVPMPEARPRPMPKGAADENFPVASRLIARPLRPHVMGFYGFARAADDIADSAALTPAEKLARLDQFESALDPDTDGPAEARALALSLAETGVSDRHARTLLAAFRHDAVVSRTPTWAALADYCALSAHPVGHFMLDLHGEAAETRALSDPLTAALQVLNHLQDIASDYRALDRVYLPADWMAAEGVVEGDLARPAASPGLRRVIDRCLDGCDVWLDRSAPLPGRVRSRRLAAEAAVIQRLARRLAARLRREDPLGRRVRLTRTDTARAALAGLTRLIAGPAR